MNIKQAPCLARIVAPTPDHEVNGWIVSVEYRSPVGNHTLPDGMLASTNTPIGWVCKSLMHSKFPAARRGKIVRCRYIVISDDYIRPLPGIDAPEEITEREPIKEPA